MKKQFKNQNKILEEFGYEFLVLCPNCNGKAKVVSLGEPALYRHETTKRCLCTHCGFTKDSFFSRNVILYSNQWMENAINIGGAYDWYFGYSLYLQTPCCGHILWAYNQEHLTYLKTYVAADLRENRPYYLSVESRLPLWMKSRKNRNSVLRAIEKLEQRMNGK